MSGWVGDGRLSVSAPPPPHKFLGATSAQLPGPRAPCALNWRKKNKKASSKQRAAGPRPPRACGRVPAGQSARGAPGRLQERQGARAGLGRRLCPGQQQSPLQDPDPSLHPVQRLWPGKCRWRQETARRWWDWHQVPRGCPRGRPQLSCPSPTGPQRDSVGRKVALE